MLSIASRLLPQDRFPPWEWAVVWTAALVFASVMSTLSILQFHALHVPHGDSGMYEEHLWNVVHGKGYRSQIDDGRLFLGEHFQFFHLLLIPIYLLWPSLEILNVLESTALASGALAIFLLAQRMGIARAGLPLALAYLCYFPLHYLDLDIVWKTFRPESFGVPLLFWGLWALEGKQWKLAGLLILLANTAKEDYGITTGAIGVWLVARSLFRRPIDRAGCGWGGIFAVGSAAYLFGSLLWIIPYFRGDAPHYTAYFEGLGKSTSEVAWRLLVEPKLLIDRVATPEDAVYLFLIVGPLLFVPLLLAPDRFAITLPTFLYLTLSTRTELAQPWFHFHAPIIPILFWASLAGLRWISPWLSGRGIAWCMLVCCLVMGWIHGRSPISARFWDPKAGIVRTAGPNGYPLFQPMGDYFRDVYFPTERSRSFPAVLQVVTANDRIAATDYVRSRFTHFRAAFIYPEFRKQVKIDDVDVVVVDRTEGWWGRGPTNPDVELIRAVEGPIGASLGKQVSVRGRPFRVVLDEPYWWVARQERPAETSVKP